MPAYMKLGDIKGEAFAGTVPNFPVPDGTTIAASALDNCTTGDVATVCTEVSFQTLSYPSFDALIFRFTDVAGGNPGSSTILFADGTFDALGIYTSVDGGATLALSPVPEAATWLMLVIGIGMLGARLKRRHGTVAV